MQSDMDLFGILPEDKIPAKGKILISEPFLPDTFFSRSIVYLTEHNPQGSVGFILNKTLEMKVSDAIEGFETWDGESEHGWPCST